ADRRSRDRGDRTVGRGRRDIRRRRPRQLGVVEGRGRCGGRPEGDRLRAGRDGLSREARAVGRIDTFVERTGRWLHVSAQAVLVFMMVSISYDAIMRYAFSAPTVWSLEVNTFLLGYLALMPAAAVLRSGDQLHIVFFRERLGVATGVVVDIAVAAIGVIFCLVM